MPLNPAPKFHFTRGYFQGCGGYENRLKPHYSIINALKKMAEYNFGGFGLDNRPTPKEDEEITADDATEAKRSHRRTKACTTKSQRYEYRRAFSEVRMLEAMEYVKLENGVSYHFITAGDVDSLTYLKIVLNQHSLDFALMSTWVLAAEDILQIREWIETGKLRHVDIYVGEIFPGSYKVEWAMLQRLYEEMPDVGRCAVFRNHSKIYAGYSEADDFYFGIQTSANINTNPRTEQGCITVDKGLYEFYREYFDGINSFEK